MAVSLWTDLDTIRQQRDEAVQEKEVDEERMLALAKKIKQERKEGRREEREATREDPMDLSRIEATMEDMQEHAENIRHLKKSLGMYVKE